jgi:hypothetical protein
LFTKEKQLSGEDECLCHFVMQKNLDLRRRFIRSKYARCAIAPDRVREGFGVGEVGETKTLDEVVELPIRANVIASEDQKPVGIDEVTDHGF